MHKAFIGGFEDDRAAGYSEAETLAVSQADVLIAVAASGSTPYTLGVCDYAAEAGALIIGLSNNSESPLLQHSSIPVLLDTGPEVIAGSTRLAAGTAQRAALGMFSTLLMTRLGHVYSNMMVNLIADNQKLVSRAVRILESATKRSTEDCTAALQQADGSVKLAILLLMEVDSERLSVCWTVIRRI